jgi:hypothetical protein
VYVVEECVELVKQEVMPRAEFERTQANLSVMNITNAIAAP